MGPVHVAALARGMTLAPYMVSVSLESWCGCMDRTQTFHEKSDHNISIVTYQSTTA